MVRPGFPPLVLYTRGVFVVTFVAMTEGGVVLAVFGVAFGLLLGLRWARMQHARSGWSKARADVPKAKAARKTARGKFWLAWRAAVLFGIVAVAYIMAVMRGAR